MTSTIVALASVRQQLQQAVTDLGEDLTTDIILTLEELDSPALTCLDDALILAASSFNSLSEEHRKEAVLKSWGNKHELEEMLTREYPPCLDSLFKDNVEIAVSNFLIGSSALLNSVEREFKAWDMPLHLITAGEVTDLPLPAT